MKSKNMDLRLLLHWLIIALQTLILQNKKFKRSILKNDESKSVIETFCATIN